MTRGWGVIFQGETHTLAHTMSYGLEHLLVAALVYSCGKKMKPFSYFFQYLSEYQDTHFIND